MRTFGTILLFIGLAVLLIAGLLSVIRDLLSRSVFASPHTAREDSGFSCPDNLPDAGKSGSARN
jgi:hypothetical protein